MKQQNRREEKRGEQPIKQKQLKVCGDKSGVRLAQ
jgi:hypothetical protein